MERTSKLKAMSKGIKGKGLLDEVEYTLYSIYCL
jgi:hypothetical protein